MKETDNEIVYYTYGNGLIAQEKVEKTEKYASEYLVYHFNNVGSTVAVTDGKGAITHAYSYTPYGELINGIYGEVDYTFTTDSTVSPVMRTDCIICVRVTTISTSSALSIRISSPEALIAARA